MVKKHRAAPLHELSKHATHLRSCRGGGYSHAGLPCSLRREDRPTGWANWLGHGPAGQSWANVPALAAKWA